MFWSDLIDMLRALILGVAQVCNGSVGVAVILVSLTIRLALLPLTLHLARRARAHQQRLRDLKPQLDRVLRRYAGDPFATARETAAFYRRRGVKQVDPASLLGGIAQIPIFAALYSTLRRGLGSGIRFFWIADTSVPNLMLTLIVAGMTAAGMAAGQAADVPRTMQVLTIVLLSGMTIWFLSSTSALFALSTGAGSAVSLLQTWLLRRTEKSAARI